MAGYNICPMNFEVDITDDVFMELQTMSSY